MANSVDIEKVAHYEVPHLDLLCLQIQQLPVLMLSVQKQLSPLSHIHALAILFINFFHFYIKPTT